MRNRFHVKTLQCFPGNGWKIASFGLHITPTCGWFKQANIAWTLGRHDLDSSWHYSDVIMGEMASQITSLAIVYSTVDSGTDQRNIKAPRHWPLCGEVTGDRWIPRTNGQQRGNSFHLMTSSWHCDDTTSTSCTAGKLDATGTVQRTVINSLKAVGIPTSCVSP